MDPETVDLLMAEGKMPNFATLRTEGAYGRLMSSKPMLSPIIWTTIATGKPPEQHRIGHFVAVNEQTGEQLPVTSQMRKVKALWNILTEAGRRVDVVGWWATWPAERVQGALVSDHTCYHFLSRALRAAPTRPAPCSRHIRAGVAAAHQTTGGSVAGGRAVRAGQREELNRPFRFDDDLSHFKWALATAESYRRSARIYGRPINPDADGVHRGTDSVSHLFGHLFRAQGLGRIGGAAGATATPWKRCTCTPIAWSVSSWLSWMNAPRCWSSPTTASSSERCRTIRARHAICDA
jgi:hypothetical protein